MTQAGRVFRPSDWAERLCGVLSHYRPPGRQSNRHIGYSPYAKPTLVNGIKCVVVDERLGSLEPKAMNFVLNFAKDNDLQVVQACYLPGK